MKTFKKTTRAILLAFVAAILFVATALALTACNKDDMSQADGIKKYIGVDFMAKMNGQEIADYSTNVTLTLDFRSLDI